MYKRKWYLKTWLISLMFALWFLIVPGIIGIILLFLKYKENKSIQEYDSSLLDQIDKLKKETLESKREELEKVNIEINTVKEKLKNTNSELNNISELLIKSKNENIKLSTENSNLSSDTKSLLKQKEDLLSDIDKLNLELQKINLSKESTNKKIKEMEAKYNLMLSNATSQSEKIIENAEIKAKEIAGDAYIALKNSEDLKKTAKAIKNTIEGYGNEYIVPADGILDKLADDFGYVEAGDELKKARQKSKLMSKNGLAAKCDYVELNRKTTAISFVTDAFNGKVDTILSTVKATNYGILKQKIIDSFMLVNNLGEAFRNAVITQEYLQSRLDELKWAVATFELKEKEKEEQRIIKEQIREEEMARRDYEKAIKEAAKEEDLLKKLMEKAKLQLQEATEQQKAEYESKLIDLQQKLQEVEDKNQRALSMAQQTKSGHVYIISNIGSFGEDVYKIGMTRRLNPLDRVKELGDASVPFAFDVHSMIFSDDAPKLETELHKIFNKNQVNKINSKKEFFKVNIKEIREQIEELDIQAKWTMLAEAKEYRESLAIENKMKSSEEFAS